MLCQPHLQYKTSEDQRRTDLMARVRVSDDLWLPVVYGGV